MNCPRCNTELKEIQYEKMDIDSCPGCHGEFLDAGELQKIIAAVEETFTPELKASLARVAKATFSVDDSIDNEIECPKCEGVKMNRFRYAGTTGIILDKCPQCSGIWFDKDELEQVQALSEEWNSSITDDQDDFALALASSKAAFEKKIHDAENPHSSYEMATAVYHQMHARGY